MENPLSALRKRQEVDLAFKRFAQTPDGKLILEFLYRSAFGGSTTFVANSPEQTFMNEGSRRWMLSILKKCYADNSAQLQQLEEMYREHS